MFSARYCYLHMPDKVHFINPNILKIFAVLVDVFHSSRIITLYRELGSPLGTI